MRYDEIGLSAIVATRHIAPWEPRVAVVIGQEAGQVTEPPSFSFAKAAATAAGLLLFLGLGLGASILVGVFSGPLWGIGTAVALGGGFYIWRAYEEGQYRKLYGVNA